MSDDRPGNDTGDKSWINKFAELFSSEPHTRSDLQEILALAVDNEIIDSDARSIMEGAMEVSDMQARDIMIPRTQMVVIKADSPLEEILPQIIQTAHSRYPVVGDGLDEVCGILLAKDLLPQILNKNNSEINIQEMLRPAVAVPESKRLNVLLREFRENRNHMAIVIDEYGGVAGLVTIEDVLEEIVGDIEDETDAEVDHFIRKITEDDFFVKALTPIEDFNEFFGTSFSDEEFDTIGGLVIQALGHMPARNETATIDRFEFQVINADQRKIHSLRMRPLQD
jgi:magnesium and cobalt transporter